MKRRLVLSALFGLLTLGYAAKCPKQRTSPGREILCYTSSSDVKTIEDSICRCTTLVHQGHDLQDLSTSGLAEFQKSLKEWNPVLQLVVSINDKQGSLKTSARVRLDAVARIVGILNEVDGVELNVTAGSKERLVHFVQGLKNEMVRKSKEKRILMVLPTKPQDLAKQFDIKALSKYVDLFTIPTDYLVDVDEAYRTFHPSRLMGLFDMLNADSLVDLVIGLGADKRKILISLPASAYKFTLAESKENAPRSAAKDIEPMKISRSEMCEALEKGEWIVERDEDLTAPYAFKDDTWIAFEDKISAGIKGKYVLLRDLAGLGIQSIEKDSAKCGKSLTEEIYHSFMDNKRKTREAVLTSLHDDIQEHDTSYPDHVKSSDFRIVRIVDTDGHIHATRENMQTEFSCTRQGFFVHPKSCNRFYRCVKFNQGVEDYSVFEFDCPAGLAFDERTEVCVWPGSITEGSACPGSSEIAPAKDVKFTCPDHPGYYADPHNCRFFYACYDLGEHELTAYEFRCPYGLVFDEEKLICEWPYLVPKCGGSTYERKGYNGGHIAQGHGSYGGYDGHGGSSEGGYDQSAHGEHGGSSDGGYDQGKHGGHGGSSDGGYDQSAHGQHGGSSSGGYDQSANGEHGGSSDGGYHQSGHGAQDSGHAEHGGESHTTIHSGHGGNGHTTDYSGHGGESHTTVHSGYEDGGSHGGSSGGYDHERTTAHTGYGGNGHTTSHSGHDDGSIHGGSSEGGYDHGRTTVHSGYGDDGQSTIHSGHGINTHTTIHSGYDGGSVHGGSSAGGYNHEGTTIHSGHGTESHTTIHSGYNGGSVHGGSSDGGYNHGPTTIHPGHDGDDHTIVHPGYSDNGRTTIHSGYEGGSAHDSSGGGYNYGHSTVSPGHGAAGHTTVHSEFGGGDAHVGISGNGHDNSHTTVHAGYHENGRTTIHSGYDGGDSHDESSKPIYEDSSQGEHGHQTDGGHAHYTTIDTGVYTGVTAGVYDGHTPVIQYGGAADTHEINHNAGSLITGNTGSSTYHGNLGPGANRGYTGATYAGSGSGNSKSSGNYRNEASAGSIANHTPVIQYGGQTASAGAHEISHSAGSNTGSTTYHGNFGSSANRGYTGGAYAENSSGNSKSSGNYRNEGSTGSIASHTPVIQYGSQTGSAGTHEISHSAGSLIPGNTVSTTYQGNFGSGANRDYAGSSYSQSGLGGTKSSSDYRQGGSAGSIATGSANHGFIGTSDSTSGTVYTQGDVSGTVVTGSNEQGDVRSGLTHPGYVQTHSGAPGYVLHNGVKTTYDDYRSTGSYNQGIAGNGVIYTGSRVPEAVVHGQSSPRTYLTGHNYPEVVVGGAVSPGTTFSGHSTGGQYYPIQQIPTTYNSAAGSNYPSGQGSFNGGSKTPNYQKNPFLGVKQDTGYKTNEYHDNGGRGTIRYNNGEVTHKYTEDDVKDYHAQHGTLPKFDVSSYETSSGGFTKTGPTKTGITTAQLGGSASYVAAGAKPRPFSNTQNIGASAFNGNSQYSDGSSKTSNGLAYGISTSLPDGLKTNYDSVDISKINLGSKNVNNGGSSFGYSYTKPAVPFNDFGVSSSTKAPFEPIKQEILVHSTSPAPFLDVHVYNNPLIVTPAPVTPRPALVNSYTKGVPPRVHYQQTMYQAAKLPSLAPADVSTGIYPQPSGNINQPFPRLPSTASPIAFTTGPLENFKTTVFEAARLPVSISTIQPIIDTGYKTVVSPTKYPINANANNLGYSQNTDYSSNSQSTKDKSLLNVDVSFQPHLPTQGQYENGDKTSPAISLESAGYGKSRGPFDSRPSVVQGKPHYGSVDSSDYTETHDYTDYTYKQTDGTFGQKVSQDSVTPTAIYRTPTPVTASPMIYNVPTSTFAPAIAVTYRKPFQVVTSRPSVYVPSEGYSYSKPSVKFVGTTSPSISYKNPSIDGSYETQTNGGSPTNLDIPRKEVQKLITNYDRGGTKFTPSIGETYIDDKVDSGRISSAHGSQFGGYERVYSTTPNYNENSDTRGFGNRVETSNYRDYAVSNGNFDSNLGGVPSTTYPPISKSSTAPPRKSPPSRRPSTFAVTTPTITTYSGGYGTGSSTSSYESTTSTSLGRQRGQGKVIVKFSDLHPLLLGKLGAECTCKADPFANFRGGKPLPINSSKGRVDLSNYDESEIYVDLESSKEENGDYDSVDSAEYITNVEDSTKTFKDNVKSRTPVIAVFDGVTPGSKGLAIKSRRPSSAYLPVSSSTYLPPLSSTLGPSPSTYLPAGLTASRGNSRVAISNNDFSASASFTNPRGRGASRSGKSLGDTAQSRSNDLPGQGTNFDRYGPGGLRGMDESLEGTSDCARPGLFRHPNYCNKFYACHWDEWKKKFTLHVFNCPVHLTFDSGASACNWPSKGPACQDDNLLV